MNNCAPCTIQNIPMLDTLLLCAVGGVISLSIGLACLALYTLAEKVWRACGH